MGAAAHARDVVAWKALGVLAYALAEGDSRGALLFFQWAEIA